MCVVRPPCDLNDCVCISVQTKNDSSVDDPALPVDNDPQCAGDDEDHVEKMIRVIGSEVRMHVPVCVCVCFACGGVWR